jgi:archaeoflavoprotein AfpA
MKIENKVEGEKLLINLMGEKNEVKKRERIAWGITGCGDRLAETCEIMKDIKKEYEDQVEIRIYISKAGEQVLKYYNLIDDLKKNFNKYKVEVNSNSPFLAGALQLGKFNFLLIAPCTSNTVAKIALGISDSMLSNSALMALKASISVYLMPSDYKIGELFTRIPDGQLLKLRIRREDVNYINKINKMKDAYILKSPKEIYNIFDRKFKL